MGVIFCLILQVSTAFWTKWMIASGKEFTKKTDFFHFNFIVLFLHLWRWKLAVVTFLLLKFSQPFVKVILVFITFSHVSSFSFLTSIFRQNLTFLFFKFSCFFVVLFVSNFFVLNPYIWHIKAGKVCFVATETWNRSSPSFLSFVTSPLSMKMSVA